MIDLLIIFTSIIVLLAVILSLILWWQKGKFGTLAQEKFVYSDSQEKPAKVLYSEKRKLKGKPDYLLQIRDAIIPVEVKTGRTPSRPYSNHIMQLIAYCALVEENYNTRPTHGILRYPGKEFVIEYTDSYEQLLMQYLQEIQDYKQQGIEPHCQHAYHQV